MSQYLQSWKSINPFSELNRPEEPVAASLCPSRDFGQSQQDAVSEWQTIRVNSTFKHLEGYKDLYKKVK